MELLEAIVLAIIEGITEFLPISSTGHMIIAAAIMGIQNESFTKVFEISIQFGAILSVVILYFKKFLKSFRFYMVLFCGFLPTALAGLLLKPFIERLLENVYVVSISLLLGGVVLLFVDKWFEANERNTDKIIDFKSAFIIGIFQSISIIPGVSRAAATIIGGLTQGVTRKTATEFSFFLAVPTMFAAMAKSIYDEKETLLNSAGKIELLLTGNIVAFIVAMLAIRFFINILPRYGFKYFGYYRIFLGTLILFLLLLGYDLKLTD